MQRRRFNKVTAFAGLFSILFNKGFSSNIKSEVGHSKEYQSGYKLLLTGQSLIEYDLREYPYEGLPNVIARIKQAAISYTHLEVVIDGPCAGEPIRDEAYLHKADTGVLDCLKEMSFDILSLSGNHSFDLGVGGIMTTEYEVAKRGFLYAGTGANIQKASEPGVKKFPQGKISIVSMATGSPTQEAFASTDRPGVNRLLVKEGGVIDIEDKKRNLQAIRRARSESDIVIAYHHNHFWSSPKTLTAEWQRNWAKLCIDSGASIYVSHGVPLLHGIEVYKNCPIFYSLGNFIFHTKTPIGHYEPEVWESVIIECTIKENKVESIELVPIILNEGNSDHRDFLQTRGRPSIAQGPNAIKIINKLTDISKSFDTRIEVRNDIGVVSLL